MGILNLAVREAEIVLTLFKSDNKLSKFPLVIKVLSVFTIVLGHHLNSVCDIQLYD